MKNNLQVGRKLYIGQRATLLGLAITTVITVATIAAGYADSPLLALLASVGAAVLVYLAVDGQLDDLLPWVAANTVTKEKKGGLYWMLVVGTAALFAISTTLTIWSRYIVADTVVQEANTSQETEAIRERTAATVASVATLRSELAELRKSEAARIKAAEKAGKELRANAIQSGGAKLADLYYSGNGWAAKKLSKAIRTADTKATALIQAERDKTARAEAALSSALSGKDEVSTNLSKLAVSEVKAVEARKALTGNVLLIFDLIFAFGAILFTFGYALFAKEYPALAKEIETPTLTWGGVFGKAITDGNQAFLSLLSSKVLRVSVVSATATPPNVSPIAYTETPAPKRPEPLFQTRPKGETGKKTKQEALEIMKEIESLRGGIRTQRSRLRKAERFLQKSGLSSDDVQAKQESIKTYNAAIQRNEAKIARLLEELNS